MSLRLRQLQLRVQTSRGLFGAKLQFDDGLVLLRAENNMGKSTCIQAIIYALGLEKMLGPSTAIPLPHAMTKYVEYAGEEVPVLESEVVLEVENDREEHLTIRRGVVGADDTRLVSTWEGAVLTAGVTARDQRDYFLRDPGSAQHEAGFARRLTEFIGWQLPTVRKYNGSECPLYLEAIFPLFVVEQKHGWAGIQSNLPTYFGIREMAERSTEFVLDLDAARVAEERQRLEQAELELRGRWRNLLALVLAATRQANGRATGLPDQPTSVWPPSVAPTIEVFRETLWTDAQTILTHDREQLRGLEETVIPTANEAATEAAERLRIVRNELAAREAVAGELLDQINSERAQLQATDTRLASLREDLRRNKDALKLKSYGSEAGWRLIEHACPTCQQAISETLMPQNTRQDPMSIEENITFIDQQRKTFERVADNAKRLVQRKEAELQTYRAEMDSLRGEVRSLRQSLISPGETPSVEAIRRRVDMEARIANLERAVSQFEELMQDFEQVAGEWRGMLEAKRSLPSDGFTASDNAKLTRLEQLLRQQLREFGFSSLNPDTLQISRETYRPTREGFDLGFDLSASDNIRTIWAYLEGLLELTSEQATNHVGMLIFDEPRQQEAAELSFARLLKRAATARERRQQVVFATSEPLATIERLTQELPVQVISFDGWVIKPM